MNGHAHTNGDHSEEETSGRMRSRSTNAREAGLAKQLPDAVLSSRALQPATSRATSPARGAPPTHLYSRLPEHCLLPDGTPDYLRLILTSKVYDLVQPTPMAVGTNLSTRLGCNVLLKREDLQPVFSFKIRGAFNLMAHLTEDERWKGVIACSAGVFLTGLRPY